MAAWTELLDEALICTLLLIVEFIILGSDAPGQQKEEAHQNQGCEVETLRL